MTKPQPVTTGDIPQLAEIYAEAFDIPWSEATFQSLLASGACGLAIRDANTPIAFILWRTAADEAEILTLATAPRHRRNGHATQLLNGMITELHNTQTRQLHLEVRATASAALQLYQSLDFTVTGKRPAYYAKPDGSFEDAILMTRPLVPNALVPNAKGG